VDEKQKKEKEKYKLNSAAPAQVMPNIFPNLNNRVE
jgi:hypothetical protein